MPLCVGSAAGQVALAAGAQLAAASQANAGAYADPGAYADAGTQVNAGVQVNAGAQASTGAYPDASARAVGEPSVAVGRAGRTLERGLRMLALAETLPIEPQPTYSLACRDPVFAYLLGLLDDGRYGLVQTEHLRAATEASSERSKIPYELIRDVVRMPDPGGPRAWIRMRFHEPLDVPVPYSILGYHPGSILSTPEVVLMEWRIGDLSLAGTADQKTVELSDVTVWGLVEGRIDLDIDGWVDFLLGGKLDDTRIVALAVYRYAGERYALAAGFNDEGRGHSGALDLQKDEIRFPAPDEFKLIGRQLRQLTLQRLARHGIVAWTSATD